MMFHDLNDLIPAFLKKKALDKPVKSARIISYYKQSLAKLGLEPFMTESNAFRITGSTLWIAVKNNFLAQELAIRKEDIIDEINRISNQHVISDFRFHVTNDLFEHEEAPSKEH